MAPDRDAAFGRVDTIRDQNIDKGLRAYMLGVYNYMTAGLAVSGIIAYFVSSSPAILTTIYTNTALTWMVILAPLAFIIAISMGIQKMKASTVQALYWAFAITMGISLSSIFVVYTSASIARVFFITAATFGAMSLYGYTTKKDLTGWGSFLFMGLIGIIIASVVNFFMASAMLDFAISVIGVLVFVGLTAYDTQKIRNEYSEFDSGEVATKKSVYGALRLYLDFINLMMMLLRLFGDRR
jgi:FtsH-binding integral membrane protein